jgi:hypothetical protein
MSTTITRQNTRPWRYAKRSARGAPELGWKTGLDLQRVWGLLRGPASLNLL